ncbi:MAG: leucine-rich repeat protein, partial [Clostridia bacterium]|nr:leucine-rich repeat protein [Clostridia bacterium]
MKFMQRIAFFGGLSILLVVLLLTACEKTGNEHLEHIYGDWVTDFEPTCLTDGSHHATCTVCGETKSEVLSKLGHDEIVHEAKAATCSSVGWDTYVSCSRCDYTTYTELLPLPHEYGNGVCTLCEYQFTLSTGLHFVSNGDGTCYLGDIGTCTDTDILIPPVSPAGDSVTGIGAVAFHYCDQITSVMIPDSVLEIGTSAFSGCGKLTSVRLPANLLQISTGTFSGCVSLTSITLPWRVGSIGSRAFQGCSELVSVTMQNRMLTIEYFAFNGCNQLKEITLPDSVTTIGEGAFRGCSSLTSITIPSGVTQINHNMFENCSSLTSVTLSNQITTIDSRVFAECNRLTDITIPSSVTRIEFGA